MSDEPIGATCGFKRRVRLKVFTKSLFSSKRSDGCAPRCRLPAQALNRRILETRGLDELRSPRRPAHGSHESLQLRRDRTRHAGSSGGCRCDDARGGNKFQCDSKTPGHDCCSGKPERYPMNCHHRDDDADRKKDSGRSEKSLPIGDGRIAFKQFPIRAFRCERNVQFGRKHFSVWDRISRRLRSDSKPNALRCR
jgi:hypothetical protein